MTNENLGEDAQGRQHPPEYRADLNPGALELERIEGSAADLKPLSRQLSDVPDDVLQRIPVVAASSLRREGH